MPVCPESTLGAAGVGVSVGSAVGNVFLNDNANQVRPFVRFPCTSSMFQRHCNL